MLKSSEFRRVYDNGTRYSGPLFTAFYLANQEPLGPRVGFTTPRALGRAVRRNFMKRRLREAVRQQLPSIAPHWDIVINPRRALQDAPWQAVEKELRKLVARCGNS
ncbi:MAG: ribonuclease P protein component [Bryobacterales bacterium]|nr:ribonuclease P protein component [Bryobacterales bacterium]